MLYPPSTGEFEIGDVILGIYEIRVFKEGFTELSKDVEVVPKQYKDTLTCYLVDFYLTPISAAQAIGPDGGEIISSFEKA